MAARLILNADDFGLTRGINRAVAELHAAGALTSATLMANGAAFDDAVRVAHEHPTLGVGCHIVFADGTPVSHPAEIPSLLGPDEKTFRTSPLDFHLAVLRGNIDEHDLIREASAQIQKLQRAGIDVTHLDTHKHTHVSPALSRVLLYVAARTGVAAMRNPFEPLWSVKASESTLVRRAQVAALSLVRRRFECLPVFRSGDVDSTQGTLGIAATGSIHPGSLRDLLRALPAEGTYELALHPGYNDDALQTIRTRLRASRELERSALLEVFGPHSAHLPGLQLIHYGELGRTGVLRSLGQHQQPTGHETVL